MMIGTQQKERRQADRIATAGRMFWKRLGRRIHMIGWLDSRSSGGASFITARSARLKPGELIVLKDADRNESIYRVVRARPCAPNLAMVGCRKANVQEDGLRRRRSASSAAHRHKALGRTIGDQFTEKETVTKRSCRP
ncbi:MAG: hypothetical protein J5J06_14475 [Phycisphaerae bacterium]|nr:hypothetical protein [Phycisphaerae bacterium]